MLKIGHVLIIKKPNLYLNELAHELTRAHELLMSQV